MNGWDHLPLWLIFAAGVIGQLIFIELGFRIGVSQQDKGRKAQLAQVRAIMGACLGLLAFLMAFTFNAAQQHFEERAHAYMQEVSAIDSAFRGADLIEASKRAQAQDLLRSFAELRLKTTQAARNADVDGVVEMIRESERIHDLLWSLAESSMEDSADGEDSAIFAQSVLAMTTAHDARLQASLFNRISIVIWVTLSIIAMLAMLVVGYQAGLTGTRSRLATWTLAITFSVVMVLITDLDRPSAKLFRMNQQLMIELEGRMQSASSETAGAPGVLK